MGKQVQFHTRNVVVKIQIVLLLFLTNYSFIGYSQKQEFNSTVVLWNDSICYLDVTHLPDSTKNYICGSYRILNDTIQFKRIKKDQVIIDSIFYSSNNLVHSDSVLLEFQILHFLIPDMVVSSEKTLITIDDYTFEYLLSEEEREVLYNDGMLSARVKLPRPQGNTFVLEIEDDLMSYHPSQFNITLNDNNSLKMKFKCIMDHYYGYPLFEELVPTEVHIGGKEFVVVYLENPD